MVVQYLTPQKFTDFTNYCKLNDIEMFNMRPNPTTAILKQLDDEDGGMDYFFTTFSNNVYYIPHHTLLKKDKNYIEIHFIIKAASAAGMFK